MALKTENLAIVLTDIAGYTEATQNQSRLDNARLLATHNRILFPIIKRYKGRHVKSIGDALLLVFRSPTDAMLCAMAMQDALFEFNRNAPKEQQIHIRVAASLGEVRVTRGDVFGEAVNITSRIEGVTPVDEIYLSEAVYMAMNKAEVPAQEVGWRELKGVSAPIRIFNIPRFSTPRLVPQDVMAAEDMSDLVYPYGGAHLSGQDGETGMITSSRSRKVALLSALVLAPLAVLGVVRGLRGSAPHSEPLTMATIASKPAPVPVAVPTPPATPSESALQLAPVAKSAPVASPPATRPAPASPPAAPRYQQEFQLSKAADRPAAGADLSYSHISDIKKALKDKRISKDQYKRALAALEKQMDAEKDQVKRDYKADKIDRKEYKKQLDAIDRKYK